MKKLLIAASAVLLLTGTISCSGSKSSDNGENQQLGDSLSLSMGQMGGSMLLMQYNSLEDSMKAKYPKSQILDGFKIVILRDTTQEAYLIGVQMALQLVGQITTYERAGIPVDRNALFRAYSEAFKADSVEQGALEALNSQMQLLQQRAQSVVMARRQAEQEAADEAVRNDPATKKNITDGQAYVAQARQNDPSLQVSNTGLVYKIDNAGSGDAITDNDMVRVKYSGRHINGEVFDSNESVDFPVRGVVPGFAEALKLLKKGGKATVIIPGEIAYGLHGSPDGSIKPMETLVFDIEVLDVNPTPAGR